jgi:hypothetical protein
MNKRQILICTAAASGAALLPASDAAALGPAAQADDTIAPVTRMVERRHDRAVERRQERRERRRAERRERRRARAAAQTPPHLEAIAACESGGDPGAIDPSGTYRGKYQFYRQTWASVGGSGDPAAAPEAEQDKRAAMLYARAGASPWPVCGA